MANIIGRFCFELDGQNLKGKFSNNIHLFNYPETAIRINGTSFIGQFSSSWTDETNKKSTASLVIGLKNGSTYIYSLTWFNQNIEFMGEGFVIDVDGKEILIGDYRNF
ncbi:MAG: hypothetical protein JST29_04915 [Bacteroidetes bacterium]|nr:hypothetical protein [Bacteroidota bacterium]MBS1592048.1 hypothetical protein [Bacteroidota bacterium]